MSVFSERPSSNAVGQDAEHGAELLAGILAVEPDHLDGVSIGKTDLSLFHYATIR